MMNDTATAEGRSRTSRAFSPTIGLAGFGVLLGWHFLIIYFSFPMTAGMVPTEFLFIRQVALNASLCVFFGLFGRMMANLPQRNAIRSHKIAFSAMAIGALGSSLLVAGSIVGVIWSILAVVMIGASEAVLMLFWLRFYTETSENYSGKSLGASAVVASLICFFTYHLTFEVSIFVLVTLPILSGTLLVTMTRDIPLRSNDLLGAGIPDWEPARKPFWKTTAQLMAMAFFFGIVQGCNTTEKTLLPAADPLTVLGAALAGIVLFALYTRNRHLPNLSPVISTSLMMYIAGMMLLPFGSSILSQVAAFLIMTGFIFYFILTLIFIIDLCRTFDLNTTRIVGLNQALEYAMFAIGILAGNVLWEHLSDDYYMPFAIAFTAIFVLVAITVFLTTERPPWEATFYKPKRAEDCELAAKPASADENVMEEVDVMDVLADRHGLTPREIEVFALLSRGRNAEFIQNTLFISNHTVKTHIYNIYRKMDIHSLQELLDLIDVEEASIRENQPCGSMSEPVDEF